MVSRLGGSQPATPTFTIGVDPCQRCIRKHTVPITAISRGEGFCTPCFERFLATKIKKKLGDDNYKPLYLKDKTPVETTAHVLIPVLSCTLMEGLQRSRAGLMIIEFMAEVIRGHRKTHRGRQGMYLHVLEIGTTEEDRASDLDSLLKERYTESEISSYDFKSLDSFFNPEEDGKLWTKLQIDTLRPETPEPPRTLDELMSILPSKTSRADLQSIILSHVISAHAHQLGCQTIFQPSTLTFLAEQSMAAVCKGRGIELGTSLTPSIVGPSGLIEILPLADLYSTEIKSYLALRGLDLPAPLLDRANKISNSSATKALSMDQLLCNYFEDIDAAFPSVTTTVVRTIEKLATPFEVPGNAAYVSPSADAESASSDRCRICNARRQKDALSWLHKISVMELDVTTEKTNQVISQGPQDLCYGCVVAFRNSGASHIMWPTAAGIPPTSAAEPRHKKEDILKEYEL